jgi:hypothetical protein
LRLCSDAAADAAAGALVNQSDRELLRKGDLSVVDQAGATVRPISEVGGGAVKGTGTGLVNNAKDTVGLIGDAVGFALNKASGGLVYDEAAGRTSGRIDAAKQLVNGLVNDPKATIASVAQSYVAPFQKSADQFSNGQVYDGTATATEATSDLIVKGLSGLAGGALTALGIVKKVERAIPDVKPPAGRPSPRQAEIDAANNAGPDFVEQQSFKGGEAARFGEPGSVRPDAFNCKTCTSLEVKAFDLNRPGGISSLTSNIAKQAKEREVNLPKGAVQEIIVDARGQVVSKPVAERIIADIVRKSGGIIKAENITIKRK